MIFVISSTENKRLLELEIELENFKDETEELKTKLLCFKENKRLRKWKKSEAVEQLTPKTFHMQPDVKSSISTCLGADVSYFLCCTRKRDVCVTPSLIVFQRSAGRVFYFA